VTDVPAKLNDVRAALADSLAHGRYPLFNVYGDGHAGRKIVDLLATTSLTPDLMAKCNAY
jgi:GDP/UDP-N,N'-diacetylbacillosamine 2-epimerase (hydrolysing)